MMEGDVTGVYSELTTFGAYVRFPIGRPPPCRLDVAGGRCRLIVFDKKSGQPSVALDAPLAEVTYVRLRVGQLTLTVGGRKYNIILATPNVAARIAQLGMATMGAASAAGMSAVSLAGSLAGMAAGHRRNKQVDPEGLRCLGFFASHGIRVEGAAPWKSELRYALMGIPILVTAIAVVGSFASVAEAGGWTSQARSGVFGSWMFVVLAWLVYGAVVWLLWKTVPRDTARRLLGVR